MKIQLKVQNLCSCLQLYKVARFKFLTGRFWPPSLMFDTPALRGPGHRGCLEANQNGIIYLKTAN